MKVKITISGVMEVEDIEALKKADWQDALRVMVDEGTKINYKVEPEGQVKTKRR